MSAVTTNGTAEDRTADSSKQITSIGGSIANAAHPAGNMIATPQPGASASAFNCYYRRLEPPDEGDHRPWAARRPWPSIFTTGPGGGSRRRRMTAAACCKRQRTTTSPGSRLWRRGTQRGLCTYRLPGALPATYQYVWSPRYIDAPILRDTYDGSGDRRRPPRIFYLGDANYNVTGAGEVRRHGAGGRALHLRPLRRGDRLRRRLDRPDFAASSTSTTRSSTPAATSTPKPASTTTAPATTAW